MTSHVAFAFDKSKSHKLSATWLEIRQPSSIDLQNPNVDSDTFARAYSLRLRLKPIATQTVLLKKALGKRCSFGITLPKGEKRRCALSGTITSVVPGYYSTYYTVDTIVTISVSSSVLWY